MKTRIKVNKSLGYSGYFWDVQEYFSLIKGSKPDWHSVGRGGYAITMWGAKRAAKRQMKKRETFKTRQNEWIFNEN